MSILSEFMSKDHKSCDDKFALAEQQVYAGKWEEANSAFKDFLAAMRHHFHIEEEILFPALLSHGGPTGPVQMMTMEHQQMNGLLDKMATLLAQQDAQSYGGLSETLLIVMQQHNMKEEQILYPLAERLLHDNWSTLHRQIEAIQ